MNKFYITTPIYYINDRPHCGHAYTTVVADILARYHRQKGERVFFLTGTDEHGAKIEETAKRENKNPKLFCDEKSRQFEKTWQNLNISYDNFIRTTDPNHEKAVSAALKILFDKGFICKGDYKGLYCQGCEQYKSERDLIDGKCPDHQKEPILMEEEGYLFKLSSFETILNQKIRNNEFLINPSKRKNEVLGFLESGLKDVFISRKNVRWGVSLPFDKSFTVYVWIDAFLNYLTGLGWNGNPKNLSEFWPPDIQLMSKDILRVHATIWPALLLGLGIPLPKQIMIHGFFSLNGQKMSKSLGNVVWPEELVKKFSADGTRYLLASALAFGQDGDISWQKFIEKYNSDLANGVGNLFERILTMVASYGYDGYDINKKNAGIDSEILNFGDKTEKDYSKKMDNYQLHEALSAVFSFIKKLDRYINSTEPWKLFKNKKLPELEKSLITLDFGFKKIILWLNPFMPSKMEEAENYFQKLGPESKKLNLFPRI